MEYKNYRPEGRWRTGLDAWIQHIPEKCRGRLAQVGVFGGDATLMFAPHFQEVVDVDPWEDADLYAHYKRQTAGLENVWHVRAPSLEAVKSFSPGSLDAVYIDADHRAPHPTNDIAAWLPIVHDHGYIGGHDYNLAGVKQAVDAIFGKPDRVFEDDSWIVFKGSQNA